MSLTSDQLVALLVNSDPLITFQVTPFVPSAGMDVVSKSNPGAWLLLRPEVDQSGNDTWRAWGKLEAWKERKGSNVVLRLSVVDGDGSSMPASQVSTITIWL